MIPSDDEIMTVIRAMPGATVYDIMRVLGMEEDAATRAKMYRALRSLMKFRFIEKVDSVSPPRWKEYGSNVDVPKRERIPGARIPGDRSLMGLCREHGLNYGTVKHRLNHGWSLYKALNTPVQVHDPEFPSKCIAKGLNYKTVRARLKAGWSEEDAFTLPLRTGKNTELSIRCKEHGLTHRLVWQRIHKLGWDEERALTTPVRKMRRGH